MIKSLSISKKYFSSIVYDVCVIGSGPGGKAASIKASQNNLKTIIIEKNKTFGGTCLNDGCIPSKVLLNTSQKYWEAKNTYNHLGIEIKSINFALDKMMSHKNKIISEQCKEIEALFIKNKVEHFNGTARFIDNQTIEVLTIDNNKEIIKAKNFIIATGSEPNNLPSGMLPIDENMILSSTGALSLNKIPRKLTIIGAGVIGLELGSIYNRLGTEVEVIEYSNNILPHFDTEICDSFQRILQKQGIKFSLGTKVIGGSVRSNSSMVKVENISNGNQYEIETEYVLIATGRRPYTNGLNLESILAEVDRYGRIIVDKNLKIPNQKNIYAIGDVIEGPMLAHKGEEEGVAAVEHICGEYSHVNYNNIPSVVYTHPEIASIGFTEEELKEKSKFKYI